MSVKKMIIISPKDNVGVVLEDIKEGDICSYKGTQITAITDIPFPHKIALTDINEENYIVKYGGIIGHATKSIKKGEMVHVHNLGCRRGTHDKEGKV